MSITINVQTIKSAKAKFFGERFSTVDVESGDGEVSLFLSGKNHKAAAENIANLINTQVGAKSEEEESEECLAS